ncbi:MAG: hypothetical protein HYW28_08515 [Rhodospirillales bacterium]|nr:hypothetical protein [Rhodospirillales bacterium]
MKLNKRGWEEEAEPEFSGPVAERLSGFFGHFLGVAEQRHGAGRRSKLVGWDYLNHKKVRVIPRQWVKKKEMRHSFLKV